MDLTDYEKSSHSSWKHLFLPSIYHSQSHKCVDRDALSLADYECNSPNFIGGKNCSHLEDYLFLNLFRPRLFSRLPFQQICTFDITTAFHLEIGTVVHFKYEQEPNSSLE